MLEMSFRCFCAVAQTGSFSRAAQLLFVTQPTVSRYVLALEKAWGFPLFTRAARKVALTQQGAYLYGLLQGFQAQWDAGLDAAKVMAKDVHGRLRLGLTSGWQIERMPILEQFCRQYPHVQLEIQKFSFFALAERLAEGTLDVVVRGMPHGYPWGMQGRFASLIPFSVPGIIRVSSTHPAAANAQTVHELGPMNMFAFSDEHRPNSTTYMNDLLRTNGWDMSLVYYPNMESVLAAVDTHLGCSYTVPLAVPLAGSPQYRFFAVDTPIDIGFHWLKENPSEPLAAFLGELRRARPQDLVVLDNIF
ncbi:MAG: LysR family transcriptional regulator [Ruminococcaceae bacterium]|nr:LysR family transcriptional regulator [Oscillospiraceae bacterium]